MALVPSAYLILRRNRHVFLMKRQNTGYEDGNFGLIAGHLEPDETFTEAMIREAREEAGIDLEGTDFVHALTLHRYAHGSDAPERLDLFFTMHAPEDLRPTNEEPDECAEIGWFPIDALPDNCIAFIKYGIEQVEMGRQYAEYGW